MVVLRKMRTGTISKIHHLTEAQIYIDMTEIKANQPEPIHRLKMDLSLLILQCLSPEIVCAPSFQISKKAILRKPLKERLRVSGIYS